jgi:hypothetical protein
MVRLRFALLLPLVACGVELGDRPPIAGQGSDGKMDGSGSGTTPTPMPMPSSLTASTFLTKIGMQYCDESFRCKATYPAGQTAFAQDYGATVAACYAGSDAYYGLALVEQSITAGRVLYTQLAAQQCIDGAKYPTDCAQFWFVDPTFPLACNAALVGTIANGATCVSLFDCLDPNSICDAATKKCVIAP